MTPVPGTGRKSHWRKRMVGDFLRTRGWLENTKENRTTLAREERRQCRREFQAIKGCGDMGYHVPGICELAAEHNGPCYDSQA